MEQFFTVDSLFDLLVWVGVIIVYLLNLFFKKSSEDKDRSNQESPHGDGKPLNVPIEEIRREILKKKKERERLDEADVELAMEADEARETVAENKTIKIDELGQFQAHIEEQSQRIKEKQEEAEQLKIYLEQMNIERLRGKAIESHTSNTRAILAKNKVRAILAKKSDIKAVLIAGEILAKPLTLRTEIKS